MSLVSLCRQVCLSLNSSPGNHWGILKVPQDLQAVLVLDPDTLYEIRERKLFVMPVQHLPREFSGRSSSRSQFEMHYVFNVGLLLPMDTFKHEDIGGDGDTDAAFELWEKVDTFIIKNIPEPYTFLEAVPEPPVEVEMNQKNFLVLTEFTVNANRCV